ncbi:MAG: type II secretion system protein GspG [Gammaproteobacteria bacterium]|nr:type II secretion system protein GspG [Gammaproteobacteria bacterium]
MLKALKNKAVFVLVIALLFLSGSYWILPIVYQLTTHFDGESKAKQVKAKADLNLISKYVAIYEKLNGVYPRDLEVLVPANGGSVNEWSINKIPIDPWGNPYNYIVKIENGNETFRLWTYGSDQKKGGIGEGEDLQETSE